VLREACTSAQWDVERWMIEHVTAVDVNYTDLRTYNTVLHSVVWCDKNKGHTPLHLACMERDGLKNVAEFIFNFDYDVNTQDNEGYTPLHWACHCGNADIVEFLMSADADVTICNEEGLTPGQVAQRTGHVELVKLLDKITFEKEVCTYKLPCGV
jgi:ankyrin repeat protein